MKGLNLLVITLFFTILLIPIVTFNFEENVISEIDNRYLMNNPFGLNYTLTIEDGVARDRTREIETYVQDRIGLRDSMILAYTILNDKLFHKMEHPTYTYGKDDYVFFKVDINKKFGDFEKAFADMVEKVQIYCNERNIPFVFVFNPAKISVLKEKLPFGINYSNQWVLDFTTLLKEKNINFIDNTGLLISLSERGVNVFNKKFNAGHWNDLGAFYGVNEILKNLKTSFPSIHINQKEDFIIEEKRNTSLSGLKFPIDEYEPIFMVQSELLDRTKKYDSELERDKQYSSFGYYVNTEKKKNGSPKALVFQGSYMNGMGYKFMQNSLGEYINVHDYQNIINFPYYYNIFKPDCVIFEVAEYTFVNSYFDYERMVNMKLNPPLKTFQGLVSQKETLSTDMLKINNGDALTTYIFTSMSEDIEFAYLLINGEEFDLIKNTDESGNIIYLTTMENVEGGNSDISVCVIDKAETKCTVYKYN